MNRDITSNLGAPVALNALIVTNDVTNGSSIDTAHYDGGIMFVCSAPDLTDGSYAIKFQDSPDNSVWTDVPADKLIGSLPTITTQTVALDNAPRVGIFSNDQWVRAVVTSTSVATGARITIYAIEKSELRPVQ
jgi:hypothetical protein